MRWHYCSRGALIGSHFAEAHELVHAYFMEEKLLTQRGRMWWGNNLAYSESLTKYGNQIEQEKETQWNNRNDADAFGFIFWNQVISRFTCKMWAFDLEWPWPLRHAVHTCRVTCLLIHENVEGNRRKRVGTNDEYKRYFQISREFACGNN